MTSNSALIKPRRIIGYRDFFEGMKHVAQDESEKQFAEGALTLLDSLPPQAQLADKKFMQRQLRYNRKSYTENPTWECLGRIFAISVLYEESFNEKMNRKFALR